jgi:ATP-dependent Clp endopeptidase proteolytic subunit ClpP
MKWKHRMNTDEEENTSPQLPNIFITSQGNSDTPTYSGSSIKASDNKILFYGDVEESTSLELNKVLMDVDNKLQHLKISLGNEYDPIIHLHVNTFGGSIFAAFSTIDTMSSLKSKVYTYVDGSVASAGTLITAVGHKRFIGKHGHLLIHQLSSGVYGKFSEMEDEIFNCTNLMKLLKDFYKKNTKIPMKKLDELLKRDIWMMADECLQYGIVDEIL